jgi:phosphate transport system substrate-binding protein
MAVKIEKGGWLLIFLIGLVLVGYSLQKYGYLDKLKGGHLPAFGGSSSSSVILRMSGSNTIGAELAPALAQAYLRQRGATDITTIPQGSDVVQVQGKLPGESSPKAIEIAAHGSATAFTDLQADKCDIGNASRRIQPQEASSLSALGDMTAPASEHVLGLDGIAIIVNTSNRVRTLSVDEIRKIFSGEITDWSQVRRPESGPINVYARDEKSGTWDTFKTLVLGNSPLSRSAQRLEDSRKLSDQVAQDPNAIGFVGLAFVHNARAVSVSEPGSQPIFPTTLTVGTEDYPLSRRLYMYTAANPSNMEVRQFVNFVLSRPGQEIVAQNGFVGQSAVPVAPDRASLQTAADTDDRYSRATRNAARLPLDFRFRSGSSALDNKALDDLDRVSAFISSPQYAGESILLLGFADSSGGRVVNDQLSKERANIVAGEFRSRGIKVTEVDGFGPDRPVASNDTVAGREKNRRVEVWLRK